MIFFDFHHHHLNQFYGIYNLGLDEKIPEHFFSVGLHPQDIHQNWKSDFESIQQKSLQTHCLAIGECGLDRLLAVPIKLQQEVLRQHVLWANEINKPVIIHCVRAFSELISSSKIAKTPLIVHGFNKNIEVANLLLKHGFYLSFGSAVLHHVSLQKLLIDFPLDFMLIETDTSEIDIAQLYQKIADIKSMDIKEFQQQIARNVKNIVSL